MLWAAEAGLLGLLVGGEGALEELLEVLHQVGGQHPGHGPGALDAREPVHHAVAALQDGDQVRPPGAGFYPDDITEQEFEDWIEANPDDHEARFQLALRKVVEQDYDAAIELLLELMQKDRSFGDDAARDGLLKVFELLGDDPRVGSFRRRMASLLH